jgi:hypothetical protein
MVRGGELEAQEEREGVGHGQAEALPRKEADTLGELVTVPLYGEGVAKEVSVGAYRGVKLTLALPLVEAEARAPRALEGEPVGEEGWEEVAQEEAVSDEEGVPVGGEVRLGRPGVGEALEDVDEERVAVKDTKAEPVGKGGEGEAVGVAAELGELLGDEDWHGEALNVVAGEAVREGRAVRVLAGDNEGGEEGDGEREVDRVGVSEAEAVPVGVPLHVALEVGVNAPGVGVPAGEALWVWMGVAVPHREGILEEVWVAELVPPPPTK